MSRADDIRAEAVRREAEKRGLTKVPAAEASASTVTGGAGTGKPLRADMFSDEYVNRVASGAAPAPAAPPQRWMPNASDIVPTAKAAALAVPIGLAETGSLALGAIPSLVETAVGGDTNWDMESWRKSLGVPEMRAAQDMDTLPVPLRMGVRAIEGVASGGPIDGSLVTLSSHLAKNPGAFMKLGAAINAGAQSAGELAASIAREFNRSPDTQEAARAWSSIVTALGASGALKVIPKMVQGGYHALTGKPAQVIEQEVGQRLAQNAPLQPGELQTAQAGAQAFRQQGMQPPPIGSLTGNPAILAEQNAAMREVPGLAGEEASRRVATDQRIQQELAQGRPQGDPNAVSREIEAGLAAEQASLAARRQQLDSDMAALVTNRAAGKSALADLVRIAGADLQTALRQLRGQAEAVATQALGALGQGMPARQAGEVFVNELERVRNVFRTNANRAYEGALAGHDSVPVDTGAIRTAAETATVPGNPLTAGGIDIPPILRAIRDSDVQTITPKQLQSLRSDLLDESRRAMGGAMENPAAARRINEVLEAVDAEFERLEQSGQIPGLDVLNAWYREGKQTLNGGLFKDAGRSLRSRGNTELPPSELAARFLRSNTQTGADEAMDQFSRAFGVQMGVPEFGIANTVPSAIAERALDEYIIQQMLLHVVDNSQLPPKVVGSKLIAWVNEHSTALARRPGLARRLRGVQRAQAIADAEVARLDDLAKSYERDAVQALADPADAALQARMKLKQQELADWRVDHTKLGRQRKAWRYAIEDPERAIDDLLNTTPGKAAKNIRDLERRLKNNPDAVAGMRAALWDAMVRRSTGTASGAAAADPLTNPEAMATLLRNHDDLMRQMFGIRRSEMFRTMQRMAAQNAGEGIPSPQVGSATESHAQRFFSALFSRAWGVARGVVGLPYVLGEGLMRALTGGKVDALNEATAQEVIRRAIYDPDYYDALTKAVQNQKDAAALRRLARMTEAGRMAVPNVLGDRKARTRDDLKAHYRRRFGEPAQPQVTYGVRG